MERIIVSFTSHPKRIDSVKQVLDSLYAQTLLPDEIILWLAEEEFPNKEADLPEALLEDLQAKRFTLRWCDNLGSHKKYYYTMQEYPRDIIITVDDDLTYDVNMTEALYQSYLRFPHAVSASRVSVLLYDEKGDLLPCSRWVLPYEVLKDEPSYQLMAIGSRGILYPPGILSGSVFDKDSILRLCKYKNTVFFNDSWLKIHELIQRVPVVCVGNAPEAQVIPKSQQVALKQSDEVASAMGETEYNLWNKMLTSSSESPLLQEAVSSMKTASSFVSLEEDAVLRNVEINFRRILDDEDLSEKRIMQIISSSLNDMNRLQAIGVSEEKWNKYIRIYQDILRKTPDKMKQSVKSLSYYALKDYGAVLRTGLYGHKYKQPAQYENMLVAWKKFLWKHPFCNPIYRKGYLKFLRNRRNAYARSQRARQPF